MSKYLFIQSKSPWESGDIAQFYALARDFENAGGEVTFFLVQNGVMAARPGARDPAFDELLRHKLRVLADDFSLRERAIDALKPGVSAGSIEKAVQLLASGAKALWH